MTPRDCTGRESGAPEPTPDGSATGTALAAVGVLALVVAAGCSAPVAPGGPPDVATKGGNLSFDPGIDYARLQSLLATDVPPPPSVRVLDVADLPNRTAASPPPTFRAFGVVPRPGDRDPLPFRYGALTGATGRIRLVPGDKPTPLVRTVLVHEYVHYIQVRRGDVTSLRERLPVDTTDGAFVSRAVLEGIAVDVTDAYVARHLPETAPNAALYDRVAETLPRGTPAWYANDAYRLGAQYVDGRADDPRAALAVVDRPPRTSEQLIHGLAPGAESPRNLSVSVDRAGTDWRVAGRDRLGEAFLRTALGELPPDRARTAAAGWGEDVLTVLRAPNETDAAYVLVTRWDDAANATEFAAAYRDAAASRDDASNDDRVTAVRRVSETTVAVLVGPERFVSATTLAGGEDRVAVVPPAREN